MARALSPRGRLQLPRSTDAEALQVPLALPQDDDTPTPPVVRGDVVDLEGHLGARCVDGQLGGGGRPELQHLGARLATEREHDVIVWATGFDFGTGAMLRMGIVGRKLEVGDPRHPLLDRHPELHAGQVGSQAPVGPAAERDVLVRLPVEVDRVDVVPGALVGVGGAEHRGDDGPRSDRAALQLGVLGGDADDTGHRRLPAQHLLDGVGDGGGIVDEALPLLGVLRPARKNR